MKKCEKLFWPGGLFLLVLCCLFLGSSSVYAMDPAEDYYLWYTLGENKIYRKDISGQKLEARPDEHYEGKYDITGNTLTLENFTFKGKKSLGLLIEGKDGDEPTVVLKGDNRIIKENFSGGLVSNQPLMVEGPGSLTVNVNGLSHNEYPISGKNTLTINGCTINSTVSSNNSLDIPCTVIKSDRISIENSKINLSITRSDNQTNINSLIWGDHVTIANSVIDITATDAGRSWPIRGKNTVVITGKSTITVDSTETAIATETGQLIFKKTGTDDEGTVTLHANDGALSKVGGIQGVGVDLTITAGDSANPTEVVDLKKFDEWKTKEYITIKYKHNEDVPHEVNIIGGGIGNSGKVTAMEGNEVTIAAGKIAGKVFKEWKLSEPVPGFDASNPTTTFTMPNKNFTATAIWEDEDPILWFANGKLVKGDKDGPGTEEVAGYGTVYNIEGNTLHFLQNFTYTSNGDAVLATADGEDKTIRIDPGATVDLKVKLKEDSHQRVLMGFSKIEGAGTLNLIVEKHPAEKLKIGANSVMAIGRKELHAGDIVIHDTTVNIDHKKTYYDTEQTGLICNTLSLAGKGNLTITIEGKDSGLMTGLTLAGDTDPLSLTKDYGLTKLTINTKNKGKWPTSVNSIHSKSTFALPYCEVKGGTDPASATVLSNGDSGTWKLKKYLEIRNTLFGINYYGGLDNGYTSTDPVKEGEKAVRPKDPSISGYVFGGWFTDKERKNLYDFDQPVTAPVNLYAKWTRTSSSGLFDWFVWSGSTETKTDRDNKAGETAKPGPKPGPATGAKSAPKEEPFGDVKPSDWFYKDVKDALAMGLMKGVGKGRFAPNAPSTRAQVVTVLHRMVGSPKAKEAPSFTDVVPGAYYAEGVAWAEEMAIVKGFEKNTFGPNEKMTREQLVTVLHRYLKGQGKEMGAPADLGPYPDKDKVSPWAREAMEWAVAKGILKGTGTGLVPQGDVTRAQVASIFVRVSKTYGLK